MKKRFTDFGNTAWLEEPKWFHKKHYKSKTYETVKSIVAFLHKEKYTINKCTKDSIYLNYGSEAACISFIRYKNVLFKNVEYYIENTGPNDYCVIIKQLNIEKMKKLKN